MLGGLGGARTKRRSSTGGNSAERACLREALRNRGGAKALVTPLQSETEDDQAGPKRAGLAWLDLNALSSTAVKNAIDRLKHEAMERVRDRGDTDAEASASEDMSGEAASLSSMTLGGLRRGVSSAAAAIGALTPGGTGTPGTKTPTQVPSKAPRGGLKAALQARGGVQRQDPKVLSDLEKVAEKLEHIDVEDLSPSPGGSESTPLRLAPVEEIPGEEDATCHNSPREEAGASDADASGTAAPAPTPRVDSVAKSPKSEASPRPAPIPAVDAADEEAAAAAAEGEPAAEVAESAVPPPDAEAAQGAQASPSEASPRPAPAEEVSACEASSTPATHPDAAGEEAPAVESGGPAAEAEAQQQQPEQQAAPPQQQQQQQQEQPEQPEQQSEPQPAPPCSSAPEGQPQSPAKGADPESPASEAPKAPQESSAGQGSTSSCSASRATQAAPVAVGGGSTKVAKPLRDAWIEAASGGDASKQDRPQPQKLKFATLGADAWWLHEGKKASTNGQSESAKPEKLNIKKLQVPTVEQKADPSLARGAIGSKEPGKLNTLQEFWGNTNTGKKSQGFSGGQQLKDSKGKLTKGEAQAALQRLVSAGNDLDEVRRLRKLISELD